MRVILSVSAGWDACRCDPPTSKSLPRDAQAPDDSPRPARFSLLDSSLRLFSTLSGDLVRPGTNGQEADHNEGLSVILVTDDKCPHGSVRLRRWAWSCVLLASILVVASQPASLRAQTDTGSVPLTPESLRAAIAETEAAADLEEERKAVIVETYRKALAYLESAAASNKAAEDLRRARAEAPEQTQRLRAKLDRSPEPVTLGIEKNASLNEIEQAVLQEQANRAAVEAKLDAIEDALATGRERPTVIRKRLTEAKGRLEDIGAELKSAIEVSAASALMTARRAMLEAEAAALNAEIHRLDEEVLSQPVRLDLLQAQRDELAQEIERMAEREKRLSELLADRRRSETEKVLAEAEAARREAEDKHPLVRELVARNAALTEEIAGLTAKTEEIVREESATTDQAKRIAADFRSVRQKLEVAGLSQSLGMVLFHQRRALPDREVLRKRASGHEDAIAVAGLWQIQREEERRSLGNAEDYVARLTAGLAPAAREAIAGDLKELAKARRELLSQAMSVDRTYLRALGNFEFAQRQLADAVSAYDDYLAGRLLWIRSAPPPSLEELSAMREEVGILLSPQEWGDAVYNLASRRTQVPALLLLLGSFAVLMWKRAAWRRALRGTADHIGQPTTDRFAFTLQALLYTVLLALPWPLLLYAAGWQLDRGERLSEFSGALSEALKWAATPLFAYRFARILCQPDGLAARHLGWSEALRKSLRRKLDRLIVFWLPAGSIAVFFFNHRHVSASGGGVERICVMVATIALGGFLYALLEPQQGIVMQLIGRDRTTLLYRLRHLWFGVALAIPILLLGLAVSGYLFTAGALASTLGHMVWFLFLLVVAHELAVRWLTVTQRRLAYKAVRERREAARAAAEGAEVSTAAGEMQADVQEPAVDLAALSDDARKLLNAALTIAAVLGLWVIWRDVLPALGILGEVTLWEQMVEISGERRLVPTTLADALTAVVIALVTIVAARRLPTLLAIVLLQRLQVSPASLYTATTLSRYVIAGVGGVLAIGQIGLSWSQVQWLVAALGVGIGFGLQEIVANFISGLLILFERPMRVGDVVTVGDASGVVTRIHIRATTIRTWDRFELLVPNKEIVTSRLLNWSLSDQITRISIHVGVAYGSEVQKAMQLMSAAAVENRRVLDDPKPFVAFDGFGDNALSLTLRCFVGKIDDRLDAINELHQAINQKFNDAGIVIAFPQRDIHFDSGKPLEIHLTRERRRGSAPP
jgi:potassium efflux system protein